MEIASHGIVDIVLTEDEQFIFCACSNGQVNMHYIGDNSF
jgi:hypothetical protein